jgi:hypothetical protein
MVIAASPLVKCYLPQFHDQLLENPDFLFDETPFTFMITHGCGAMPITFNKPCTVSAKRKTDQDAESKYKWLIGDLPNSQNETDCYGLVPFEPGIDLTERMYEINELQTMSSDPKDFKMAQEKMLKIMADTQKVVQAERSKVRAMSEARIKRAMKVVHNNLIMQWQRNQEQNMGKYPPSVSEMFGAHALSGQIDAANKKTEKMRARMNEISKNIAF